MLEQGVDADAAPAHVEFRPLRDATDVDRPGAGRQGLELVPCPGHRLADEALDRERPAVAPCSRGRAGRQDGKVRREVLPGRDARGDVGRSYTCGAASTHEPPSHESVAHLSSVPFESVVACGSILTGDGRKFKSATFEVWNGPMLGVA